MIKSESGAGKTLPEYVELAGAQVRESYALGFRHGRDHESREQEWERLRVLLGIAGRARGSMNAWEQQVRELQELLQKRPISEFSDQDLCTFFEVSEISSEGFCLTVLLEAMRREGVI